jgi:hypothetical protein
MTTYFYSVSTGGFYTSDINPTMPTDVVEITEEYYQSLLAGQSEGLQIVADAQGYPILITPVPVSATVEQNKIAAVKLLANTDWTTMSDVVSPANTSYLSNQADFIAYRNAIRTIAINPTEGDLVWPVVPTEVWTQK